MYIHKHIHMHMPIKSSRALASRATPTSAAPMRRCAKGVGEERVRAPVNRNALLRHTTYEPRPLLSCNRDP